MNLQELEFPTNHREIIDRFITVCQADNRIVAAFLGGSYVKGKVDKYSDLDLFFITTDEAYEDFLVKRESFTHLLGEPLFREDFGLAHGYCLIFSNKCECDLWFGRESKFEEIYSGPYKVLLDKKGILEGAIFPARVADQTRQIQLLQQQLDWFWHELSHFIKAMGRNQLWFAFGQIEVMRQICVVLARLQSNFLDADAGGGEPYFKIERSLSPEKLSPLRDTFCPMEYDAILHAAFIICQFYQDIAPRLAKEHSLHYQSELERMLVGQLRDLDHAG